MQKSVQWKRHNLVLFNPLIGPISCATTPGQSGPGSDGNKGVLRIPQSSSRLFSVISWTLVGGGGSYSSAEKQLVYSTAPADWASGMILVMLNQRWMFKKGIVTKVLDCETV